MGSRDQVYGSVSSLVVRPSDSEGGGNDYEPGEIRREETRRANGHSRAYDRAAAATAGDRLSRPSGSFTLFPCLISCSSTRLRVSGVLQNVLSPA